MAVTGELSLKLQELHELVLSAENQSTTRPKRSWMVHLENRKTGRKSQTFPLEDPFFREEYEELRWYVEDFAVIDPYAVSRAAKASESKAAYGAALIASLGEHINEVLDVQQTLQDSREQAIHLLVRGDGAASSLHTLLWEILEGIECDKPAIHFTVSRICDVIGPASVAQPDNHDKEYFNILYVSARPGFGDDISYRAISQHIVQLLKSRIQTHRIRLHFARPGTWGRFHTVLKSQNEGYYDLVHFDMHGSIVKSRGQDKAVLHFSPAGTASRKPDRKGAETVAKLLTECGVRFAVLNACNSATPGLGTSSNLACTFASYGIQRVAAMSYRVKTDAALLAMRSLYHALLRDPVAISRAVVYARARMRAYPTRSGRYDLHLACEDDFNLILYAPDRALQPKAPKSAMDISDMLEIQNLLKSVAGAPIESNEDCEIEDNLQIRRIQDLDMLSLEDALDCVDIATLSGESGSGKTTLAHHLREWWRETFFAEEIQCFEHAEEFRSWAENQQDGHNKSVTPKYKRVQDSVVKQQPYSHKRIIMLDNVESFDPWPENPKDAKRLDVVKNIVKECLEGNRGCRVILFTRIPINVLALAIPDAMCLGMSPPSSREAVSLLMAKIPSDAKVVHQQSASELEDVIKSHGMNLSFITTILPVIVKSGYKPYEVIERLLDDPQLCLEAFSSLSEREDSNSAFKLASERIASWPLQTDLAHRMILPFCMFQHRVPVDTRLWLYKLYETGAFSSRVPNVEPYPVRSGRIHDWMLSEGWENFPSDWTFEESWHKVRDCLLSLGMWREVVGNGDGNVSPSFLIHPLLPYFLRSEIGRMESRLKDPTKYRSKLQQSFWEYYENQMSDRINVWTESPDSRILIVNEIQVDAENMFEAIRLGLRQSLFPFRHMQSHLLTSCLNFLAMPQPRVRRWACLFSNVLERYELLTAGEWTIDAAGQKSPPEDKRELIFKDAINMAEQAGKALEALHDADAIVANADRAVRLKNSFLPLVDTSSIEIAKALYCIQVQKAKCVPSSQWSAETLEYFLELLSSGVPDEESRNSEGQARLARAELANHLLFERTSIPEDHPLHQLLLQYSPEFESMISDILSKNVGLSQLGSLSSRDFFVQSGRPSNSENADLDNNVASRSYAADVSRRLQKSFVLEAPSNARGYFTDAVVYAMDPEAVERGEDAIFDATRLRQVYEKAKQVNYKELEAFCLQQLAIGALMDGDVAAAEEYLRMLNEIGGEGALPKDWSSLAMHNGKRRSVSDC
jgi:hypothetical protein